MTPAQHLDAHRATGRRLAVPGAETFVVEAGKGPPVLCLHGVPASSYLYRKVVPALGDRGCRGIALDLPGLGFADRPVAFDYSWTGLARWLVAAVDALDLAAFHLVVHDVGGPVGALACDLLDDGRVRSLTVLNTPLDPVDFTPPPVMWPFTVPWLGRAWLAASPDPAFAVLMRWQGVADRAVPIEELLAYRHQLLFADGGRAFLQLMQSFERTEDAAARVRRGVHAVPNRQVVWGEHDPALPLERYGRIAQAIAGVDRVHRLPGKHFLQEDCAEGVADHVARLVHAST